MGKNGKSALSAHLRFESIGIGIGIGIAVEDGNRKRFAIPKAIPMPMPIPEDIYPSPWAAAARLLARKSLSSRDERR